MTAPDAPTPAAPIDVPATPSATEAPPPAATPSLSPAECAERLRALFPALFSGPAKPIKLRIQADIQARAPGVFTKAALSAFLRRYTGGTGYLIALTRAPQRLDLDGQPAGEISAEHRQAAADELVRRRAVHESRRQAEEDQRRERWQLLRAFETTTLTKDNFCALKGMTPEALDAALAQARQEAEDRARERPPQAPLGGRPDARPGRPGPGARPDARHGSRDGRPSDARGPRERSPRPPRPAR
ncbi:ProQ/FinO family protein [Ideonella sp.]|uniref:ProQ/FinO family protein n=1 Tax=Ideonella sp. TaxID=1929293 RepID=UPI002B490D03|nr:ProQ/FinO family protein [Ideonella sp.]HJV71277.1 ProQ/FinO family protein [Ideonella sp.]